jgi:hypothetical protein
VAWDYLDRAILELALRLHSGAHLKLWFQRILQDVKDNRTGFPDLIQFWPAERRYEMIEVKGPGDRLQDNQLRWIEYCAGARHAGHGVLPAVAAGGLTGYTSPCGRCANSPPSRATSTCASRPRPPPRKASPAMPWWPRAAASITAPKSR